MEALIDGSSIIMYSLDNVIEVYTKRYFLSLETSYSIQFLFILTVSIFVEDKSLLGL